MSTAPAPVLEVTVAQRTAVEAALRRRDLAPRVRERLEMVKAAGLGQDLATIARWSGRTPRTVRRWLAVFRDGGIGGAGRCPDPGAAARRPMPPIWRRWNGRRRDGAADAGPALRCLDLGAAERLPGAADRRRASPRAGCGCCCTASASPVVGRNTPSTICKTRPKSPPAQRPCGWRGKKVRRMPERYELHFEDETHLDTNPYLSRVWHRIGTATDAASGRAPTGA